MKNDNGLLILVSRFSVISYLNTHISHLCTILMKTVEDILKLGDPRLYEHCNLVEKAELHLVKQWVQDLHEAMADIRKRYGFGRGIAAPQLGIMKRLFYLNLDKPYIIINPEISKASEEMFSLWDDCMSFPNLLVKVERHQSLTLTYLDENWQKQTWDVSGAISELVQHEFDHLNGILCTMRAMDDKSFKWKA